MAGTNNRLRFYLFCDLSSLQVDYAPALADYPEYPRRAGSVFYDNRYKSAIGSNYWNYHRGVTFEWTMHWKSVSDDCAATMGMLVGSSRPLAGHVVIYDAQGIDGITTGSLFSDVTPVGTFFVADQEFIPLEGPGIGLWDFDTTFIKES